MKISNLLAALAMTAAATVYTTGAYATDTQEFIVKSSAGAEFEVQSSKIALERSQNADVKKFAQEMIDDHTKAADEMKAVLAKDDMKAPAPMLDDKHQKVVDDLKEADAGDFDKDYVDAQKDAHKDTVDLFEDYADDGDNADLKAFAEKTLPTLKMHAEHVKMLEDKM